MMAEEIIDFSVKCSRSGVGLTTSTTPHTQCIETEERRLMGGVLQGGIPRWGERGNQRGRV